MTVLYILLAHFWFYILISVMATFIWLIARVRRQKISAERSIDLAGMSIATGLAAGFMLCAAILVPTALIAVLISAFASALNLGGIPFVPAMTKWHGLPSFFWYLGGLGLLLLIFAIRDWIRDRIKVKCKPGP